MPTGRSDLDNSPAEISFQVTLGCVYLTEISSWAVGPTIREGFLQGLFLDSVSIWS